MEAHAHTGGTAVAPLSRNAIVALVVGGAIATGVWWLTDNDVDVLPEPATKVIVSPSVETGAGVAAKDEAAVAAAVSSGLAPASRTDTDAPTSSLSGLPGGAAQSDVNPSTGQAYPGLSAQAEQATGAGTAAKDEAATAAAVGSGLHQHGE